MLQQLHLHPSDEYLDCNQVFWEAQKEINLFQRFLQGGEVTRFLGGTELKPEAGRGPISKEE
jgi:hypothetical protein